jgi:8-oxo-dGTP pyrophosphatase MutT (NUDIX family)
MQGTDEESIMHRRHGPWTIEQSTEKHRDSFMTVREDRVIRPDGKPGFYSTVQVKPGVAVLPIDEAGEVYLVRQFRYALGSESLEAVCGGVEEGESYQDSAKEELREEVGIEATSWTDLGLIDIDTSMVRCKMGLFLARGLSFTDTRREGTETIQTVKLPFLEALGKVIEGEITHAGSCILILKAAMRMSR